MEWKKIYNYNGMFSISEDGHLRNDLTGNILKNNIGQNGYYQITIKPYGRDGKCFSLRLHKLVAQAFIPNPNNKPQINHKDGNKLNNHYSNLEWVTQQENSRHAEDNGLMNRCHGLKMKNVKLSEVDVIWIRENFIPDDEEFGYQGLARRLNVNRGTIRDVVIRKRWKHIS